MELLLGNNGRIYLREQAGNIVWHGDAEMARGLSKAIMEAALASEEHQEWRTRTQR